jgi:hypothetical protein
MYQHQTITKPMQEVFEEEIPVEVAVDEAKDLLVRLE